jgi:sulfatase maturation enzyme AslB (radical SAM superfamily)
MNSQTDKIITGGSDSNPPDDLKRTDPWLHNKLLNRWEQENGVVTVSSYPLDLSLPFIDLCNAKCVFCSYWGCKPRFMTLADIERYRDVFKYLAYVGINPAGEPLMHPGFDAAISKIRGMVDPRCSFYLVTNGVLLRGKQQVILDNIDSLTISLNAATSKTHESVMGIKDEFDGIIESIRELVQKNRDLQKPLNIYTTYVVLRQNLDEITEFIKLAESIGLDRIYFRNLATANDNNPIKPGNNPGYIGHQPRIHPDFDLHRERAIEAIDTAKIDIVAELDQWGEDIAVSSTTITGQRRSPVFEEVITDGSPDEVPPKRGWVKKTGRFSEMTCQYLYKYMIDPRLSNIQPVCVYMETLPGYQAVAMDLDHFMEKVRNASAMTALRRAFRDGGMIPETCTRCNILKAFKHSST